MHKYRTHTCSELTKKEAGKMVKLSGWIHRKRDHGNLLFFDLRDHYGLTQCVIENSSNFFKKVEKIKPESVVSVEGKVVKRSTDTVNKDLLTGEIEIAISSFKLLRCIFACSLLSKNISSTGFPPLALVSITL